MTTFFLDLTLLRQFDLRQPLLTLAEKMATEETPLSQEEKMAAEL